MMVKEYYKNILIWKLCLFANLINPVNIQMNKC